MEFSEEQICDILIRPMGHKIMLELYDKGLAQKKHQSYAVLSADEILQFENISLQKLLLHLRKIGFLAVVSNYMQVGEGSCVYEREDGKFVYSFRERGEERIFCMCDSHEELEICFINRVKPRRIRMMSASN